jgi:hypothetical protein
VLLAFGVVLLGAILFLWLRSPKVDPQELERNKDIEIQAALDKDPTKCDQIMGRSYYYGPVDEKVITSESEARRQCRLNIKNKIVPTRFGG